MNVATVGGRRSPARIALVAMAGASIEYYDFFIYATAATLVFPTHFFSRDLPPVVAQLAAFSTFTVGFIAGPLGGICSDTSAMSSGADARSRSL